MSKLSGIDFSHFEKQSIVNVIIGSNSLLELELTAGGLVAECPWRLQRGNKIMAGSSDSREVPANVQLKESLIGCQVIEVIFMEEVKMLRIAFSGSIVLDLFHDSCHFEGWELYSEDGFTFISLPEGDFSLQELCTAQGQCGE
ncbi:hypothetical protein [Bacillus infantis]|uniref:Uncharacterized protein n=1 Tax=Bacillus infantis TaxID=324767 RepID=A0A5D4QRZ4_9BACI|nr:hypothetical protein [Bacillus infantis]TYS41923.1 hypothetical protein FZD51_23695 [Bacillus infantis]